MEGYTKIHPLAQRNANLIQKQYSSVSPRSHVRDYDRDPQKSGGISPTRQHHDSSGTTGTAGKTIVSRGNTPQTSPRGEINTNTTNNNSNNLSSNNTANVTTAQTNSNSARLYNSTSNLNNANTGVSPSSLVMQSVLASPRYAFLFYYYFIIIFYYYL
jgi:hypothetical protein